MQFMSVFFLIFAALALSGYYIVDRKYRYVFLLAINVIYYFSWIQSAFDLLPLLLVIIVTWSGSMLIDRLDKSVYKKAVFIAALVLCIFTLAYYKYFEFLKEALDPALRFIGIRVGTARANLIAPIGLSFFTFQALSYLIDVYKKKAGIEKNIFRYAAFVSFFPTILSGPIERPEGLLAQIKNMEKAPSIRFSDIRDGLLLIFSGGGVKTIISDRLAVVANTVFPSYEAYGMTQLAFGSLCYTLQIYCDFLSYSLMAVGIARLMGLNITENFNTPYMALSIKDFWRRWHISLSTWFRDYVYIPLGGNRCSAARRHFNLMTTFLVSGLWHGANWTYVVWGGIHGIYQVIGSITQPLRKKLYKLFDLDQESFGCKLWKRAITFMLVSFAWIFFRADTISDAVRYIVRMFTTFDIWNLFNGSIYNLGLDTLQMNILAISLLIMFAVEICVSRSESNVEELFSKQDWLFQGVVFAALIVSLVVFGMYGPGFNSQEFIYFKF